MLRFSVPRNPMKTLSLVWSSGKGSSSLVWSNGRGLVRVLYPFAYVKQWGGGYIFHLILARCEYSTQCVMHRLFTHIYLRNKGDSLATLSGIHRTICSRKLDVVVGWEVGKNQSLIMITMFEDFKWMGCYVWFSMIVWILEFVCSNQGLILIIMLKCYLNTTMGIIGHVLFMNLFYISLFVVSLPLFVCLCVCCMCDDRITCVLYRSRCYCKLFWHRVYWREAGMISGVL